MRIVFLLLAAALFSTNPMYADQIFNVNLTLASGGSVTGTVTLNNALTLLTGGSLSAVSVPNGAFYPGLSPNFSYVPFPIPGVTSVSFQGTYETYPVSTLVGVLLELRPLTANSVQVCTVTMPCGSGIYSELEAVGTYPSGTRDFAEFDLVTGGSIVAATPEPSSLALLMTGVLGAFMVKRWRFTQS